MENETVFYLKKMFQTIKKILDKNFENLDLTSSQANVLMYLCRHKHIIIVQRDIEKKFELSNPTVNGILNRLENKGFIERVISKQDARQKEIHLTNKSVLLDKKINKEIINLDKKIKSNISDEELGMFNSILKKMIDNVMEERNENSLKKY